MRICIICNDLSTGASVTAMAAADALATAHDVVIVGPRFGPRLWPALELTRHEVVAVPARRSLDFFRKLPRLMERMRCDAVVACKVRFTSFAPALLNKLLRGTPVVLFVDDDEIAHTSPGRRLPLRQRLLDPGGDLYTRLAHRLSGRADAIVCDTTTMQRVYGGTVLPSPRDLSHLDPDRFDGRVVRAELGIADDDFVVGFVGVPRAHKGIDDLLKAVEAARLPGLKLLIVPPIGFSDPDLRGRASVMSDRVRLVEDQPSSRVPNYLAACDAVVIPQRRTPEAEGQLPAKLGEAMAMGKAIVATAVSDIPLYLAGAGLLVQPSQPEELAEALERLGRDAALRADLGRRARRAYDEFLSGKVLAPRFCAIVEAAAAGRLS